MSTHFPHPVHFASSTRIGTAFTNPSIHSKSTLSHHYKIFKQFLHAIYKVICITSVTLKLLTLFQHQVGHHELTYEGDTVGEILDKFLAEYKDTLETTLYNPDTKTLREFILILLNGRNIIFLDGLKTKLKEGDVIAISPPIAGG